MEQALRFRLSREFFDERSKYTLVYTCEHCAHFNVKRLSCVHGYPVDDHLFPSVEQDDGELVFCKEFELQ